jgi:hypothetical protein
MIFLATEMVEKTFFIPPLLMLVLCLGSGMDKNQDSGSGINIPDP